MGVQFAKKAAVAAPAVVTTKKSKKSAESDGVLTQWKKDYGESAIQKAGKFPPVTRIPTGIFPFDLAVGGGIPHNRVSIFAGPPSSTKSTTALKVIAAFQQLGTVALVEPEVVYDPKWARDAGVNTDDLIVAQPDNAEQVVDICEALFCAEDISLVVLDSVGSLATNREVENSAEVMQVAGSAMLCTRLVHKLGAGFARERKRDHFPTFLFINQVRMKIGQMFGDPEGMPGGNALAHIAALTARFYAKDKIDKDINPDKPTFKEVSGTVKKHKVPIVAKSFTYDLCVLAHKRNGYDMKVGDVDAWNTVSNRLKSYDLLYKEGSVWVAGGKEFKTLDDMHDAYMTDLKYGSLLRKLVIDKAMELDVLPDVDKQTGEIKA